MAGESVEPVGVPIAPQTAPVLQPGEKIMALHPAANGIWQLCTVLSNQTDPNLPLIEFPDGSQFPMNQLQIGGRVAQAPAPAVDPNIPPAAAAPTMAGTLLPNNATFKQFIVNVDAQSKMLFDLPLDALLTMAYRWAIQQELPGKGNMATFGNTSQFVPDSETLGQWLESYLLEVQRRKATTAGGAEM